MSRLQKPLERCDKCGKAPVCPPSLVLCKECFEDIRESIQEILDDLERREGGGKG
jgi:hypothetical protein